MSNSLHLIPNYLHSVLHVLRTLTILELQLLQNFLATDKAAATTRQDYFTALNYRCKLAWSSEPQAQLQQGPLSIKTYSIPWGLICYYRRTIFAPMARAGTWCAGFFMTVLLEYLVEFQVVEYNTLIERSPLAASTIVGFKSTGRILVKIP